MGISYADFVAMQRRLARADRSAPVVPPPSEVALHLQPSTDEARLNKTEKAYLAWLRAQRYAWIGIQNLTLKLGADLRYTPDFIVVAEGKLEGHEVKGGFFRDDAKVKIVAAARAFPWIRFLVVRKTKTGWEHQPVKP